MSCFMCHMSHVTCHLSLATCNQSLMPTATDTKPANSPTMHSTSVCKDRKPFFLITQKIIETLPKKRGSQFSNISNTLFDQKSTKLARRPGEGLLVEQSCVHNGTMRMTGLVITKGQRLLSRTMRFVMNEQQHVFQDLQQYIVG